MPYNRRSGDSWQTLLSENKAIDTVINFTLKHSHSKRIIICNKQVKGHVAGQALLALIRNGIDLSGRTIRATGHYPILKLSAEDVEAFRWDVEILDMIGTIDFDKIAGLLVS